MTKGLRRTLIAGAALLIFVTLLLFRLDLDSINAKLEQELLHFSDSPVVMEKATLTFMHGIGLQLDQASMDSASFHMHAGHININLRLLPLLLGKVEVEALDIHDAVITIEPQSLHLTSAAIATLPVERIHLIRSTIQTDDGQQLLNDLHLELRDIGANHETKWELQAQQDRQAVSGHGRLNFHAGQIINGFGKLKLNQIPLEKIQPIAPKPLHKFIHHDAGLINGSLTLDINSQNDWAIFGELKLFANDDQEPVKIRGKLSHPREDLLQWQDSFIHLSSNAVMAIDGECKKQNCFTQLKADNIELGTWSGLIPQDIKFHRRLSGKTDIDATINWNNTSWQGEIGFNLKQGNYHLEQGDIELPELQLYANKLTGDDSSWQAEATLTAPDLEGSMRIHSSQSLSGIKNMTILAEQVDSRLWQPLTNLMLVSLDIEPKLTATGILNGELRLKQYKEDKSLHIDLDAESARMSFAPWFEKPQNIQARCKGELNWQQQKLSGIQLNSCRLGDAFAEQVHWSRGKKIESLKLNKLSVNFDQLKNQSITLAEPLSNFRGLLEGSGTFTRNEKSPRPWLHAATGQWRLQNFGTEHWDTNGLIQADHGRFSSQRLLVDGMYGLTELTGYLSFADQRGSIDIISAQLDWNQLPELPQSWQGMTLTGSIEHAELNLLQNRWQGIQAEYRLTQGKLKLKKLKASIADGQLTARSLSLEPGVGSLGIHGKVRLKGIQLHKLEGMNNLLQAEIKGTMHANIELHGSIPEISSPLWKQTNGDILIYSGEWKQQDKARTLAERIGIKSPGIKSHAYKSLEMRFRVNEIKTVIKPVSLHSQGKQYHGQAIISTDGELSGQMTQQKDQTNFSLSGASPYFSWQQEQ